MNPILIEPNGTTTEIAPKNGTDFQLEELYSLLNCECIDYQYSRRCHRENIVIFDDECNIKPNPQYNPLASDMSGFVLSGNVICCPSEMLR